MIIYNHLSVIVVILGKPALHISFLFSHPKLNGKIGSLLGAQYLAN